MSDENVTSLNVARALKNADNRLWSPADCLQDALNDIKDKPCDKLLVIRIDTTGDKFSVGYHAAQLKASEIVATLEIMKAYILQEMGY
jgi:hypothetical protein